MLRLGDTALVLAQRLTAWTGHAPIVEEDLALANIALDLLGQARGWLTYAGEVEGRGRGEDALAYEREQHQYLNFVLVERPNGDFAQTIVRGLFFDLWHERKLHGLTASTDPRIAALAARAVKEARYHRERSIEWTIRLGDGTDESRTRMQRAIDALWPDVGELFSSDATDVALAAAGIAPESSAMLEPWERDLDEILVAATLHRPTTYATPTRGRDGRHSEALSYLLAEMQSVRRAIPGARW